MVTLIKYGALSGGEKYNINQMWIDGLSTDSKPTTTVEGMPIPNGSVYTEVDTGKTYMFDKDNTTWYEVSLGGGGGGGGGFTPTQAQLDAMNSGVNSTKVQQISTNETNISLKANTADVNTAIGNVLCNNITATFDKNKLSANDNGEIVYDGTTLPSNHQNYAFIKNSSKVNCFEFGFTGASARCGAEFCNGKKAYIVISSSSGYFRVDFYDENTSAITPIYLNNTTIPYGSTTTKHTCKVAKNGNYLLVYIDGMLLAYSTSNKYSQNIRKVGYAFKSGESKSYTEILTNSWNQYAHISFDDQIDVLKLLTNEGVTSIYDISQFVALRALHRTYGCTFTLMLFYEKDNWNLSQLPSTFKNEFIEASDWLKFGYHSHYTTTEAATDMSSAELVADMQLMYSAIRNFADECCIDYCPRLGNFSCTKEQAIAISSSGLVTGLLAADDVRAVNCGLTSAEKALMENVDRMSDYDNGILYIRSRLRFDNVTTEELLAKLNSQYNRNNATSYEFWGHAINTTTLETIAGWINSKSMHYGFAMDNVDF